MGGKSRGKLSRAPCEETICYKLGWAVLAAAFWLAVWQAACFIVAQNVLLVSPARAFSRLWELGREALFWRSVGLTCLRILAGFALALVTGSLLAMLCARFWVLRRLTAPLIGTVRATPVASFIILTLVWMATDRIPVFIAFLVVVPVVWSNLMAGIDSVDGDLLEMARVFRLSKGRVLRYIYLPAEIPHFVSACTTGLGLAWKSGAAAEVIALPRLSIGKQLHNAKIYLEMPDLFAWTIALILLSLIIEKVAIWLLRKLTARLSGPSVPEGGRGHAAGH